MKTVGAYEAKTHLARLLEEVAAGETITITKHGVPIARLVPAVEDPREGVAEAVEAMKRFRRGRKLGDLTIREMIDEGRRY